MRRIFTAFALVLAVLVLPVPEAVAFSIGEMAPDFGNTPIMLALEVDGSPLRADEGLRLIVPGDTRGARNVRDVVRIEIR